MKQSVSNFIEELKNQKDTIGILVFGSYARNEQRENSDVDVLVLVKEGAWRDVVVKDNQVFEMVYASLEKAKQFYELNPNDAVQQWTDGKIIHDPDGKMKELAEFVSAIRDKGKPKLNQKQINHLHFDKEDKIRAIEYLKETDFATASLLLHQLGYEVLEAYFDLKQLWTPAPKQRLKFLRENHKETAFLFDEFFKQKDFDSQLNSIREIIKKVFKSIGWSESPLRN